MKGYEYQSDFAKKYIAQGERDLLLRQLRVRFGELPASVVGRVESARLSEIETWAERILSAPSLVDVLGDPV